MAYAVTEEQKEKFRKQARERSFNIVRSTGWNAFLDRWFWEFGNKRVDAKELYDSIIVPYYNKFRTKLLPLIGQRNYQVSLLGMALSNLEEMKFENKQIFKYPLSKGYYSIFTDVENSFTYKCKDIDDFYTRIPMFLKSDTWKMFLILWNYTFRNKQISVYELKSFVEGFNSLNSISLLPFPPETTEHNFFFYTDLLFRTAEVTQVPSLYDQDGDVIEQTSFKIVKIGEKYKLKVIKDDKEIKIFRQKKEISDMFEETMVIPVVKKPKQPILEIEKPKKRKPKRAPSILHEYRSDKKMFDFLNRISVTEKYTKENNIEVTHFYLKDVVEYIDASVFGNVMFLIGIHDPKANTYFILSVKPIEKLKANT